MQWYHTTKLINLSPTKNEHSFGYAAQLLSSLFPVLHLIFPSQLWLPLNNILLISDPYHNLSRIFWSLPCLQNFHNPFQLSTMHNFHKYFQIHYTNHKRDAEENRAHDKALEKMNSHHLDYQVTENQTFAAVFQPLQKSL